MAFLDLDEELETLGYAGSWQDQEEAVRSQKTRETETRREAYTLNHAARREHVLRERKKYRETAKPVHVMPQGGRPGFALVHATMRDRRAHAAEQARLRTRRSTRPQTLKRHVVVSGNQ